MTPPRHDLNECPMCEAQAVREYHNDDHEVECIYCGFAGWMEINAEGQQVIRWANEV